MGEHNQPAVMVEIHSEYVHERRGTNERGEWVIREQEGWLRVPHKPYPEEFRVSLDRDQLPYPVGHYELDVERCVKVTDDRRKRLEFERSLSLRPLGKAAPKAVNG